MTDKLDLIEFGFCSKPHGIKGGFSFVLSNDEESILKKGFELILLPKTANSSISKDGETHKIASISFGNKTIAYLENINDRNLVESMIPFKIMVPRSAFPKAKKGEFYLIDIIGLKVIDHKSRQELGKVEDYYDNSAQIILKITGGIELPFLDNFVPVVSIEEGFIEVIVPEII